MLQQLDPRSESSPINSYYKEFDCSDIFSGFSIETHSENEDTLRSMPGVANVWPMRSVPLAPIAKRRSVSPDTVGTNYSMHQWTGVDKLHAQGIRGQGVKVAVIDTGIDYTHEALGGCFGPGCKVAGGYDLVGTKWSNQDEDKFPKHPDNDPMDFYGHGTHVAGIIAADNDWLTGVAPDVELLIYKVFADNAVDTSEEVLIQAFCDAYGAGADVITASIGSPNGFTDNPWAVVASRLVEKGVVVTISAGNEGSEGPFYSSSGSNGDGVLSIAAVNVTGMPNATFADSKPVAAYFTSWGPTNELHLKPEIGAPGVNVVSTVPNQQYEEMSGTSMAAPYIAGVAALYLGHHGGRSYNGPGIAKTVVDRIATSGRSVAWSAADIQLNKTAPPFQVGSGLVDAWKVLHYATQVTSKPFALLDTESFQADWSATITNNGNRTVTYDFELEPQEGFEMLDTYYGIKSLFEIQPMTIVPNVTLPKPVVLRPGQTKDVEFSFVLPDVDDDLLPMYGGKVHINGDNGERVSIPYGGAAYDTEKEFDTMFSTVPYLSSDPERARWAFDIESDPLDYAELGSRLRYACFHLRWDIFTRYWDEANWVLPTTPGLGGYIGSATSFRDAELYWYFDPNTMDKDDTVAFPITRAPRGQGSYWWFGKLANGSYIQPGNYTMRFAALRPYGNPNISDHWDVLRTPFEVLPHTNTSTNATRLMKRTY
ncbi:peptidase S8/S53 domain-containing protein [Emericellopsis atlantica]|uniref:Peptidase S8/S53 domain-containing protein n=1 Tax=Emericellopsis atlantica TaxID=2614577 RepID=A0A9P7ZEF4_9HYPO|nr:peptidase S8/S53 domain-containing protein [Emericellopsis atlantica]KAG9250584.1 peptidase S8/S53 domain-containing protein [Emericellopsis atlantica]